MFSAFSSPQRPRSSVKGSSGSVTGAFAGRYTIERELGRGATAVVYLARDTSAGAVAIKVLREELLTEVSADRFLREIRVTAQLQHPNIVPVLDSGECDGRLYFVSQYMDGGTLRERLDREKQLPLDDVITIGKTIASALQFAHERELLHRDVKPENILFGNGQACLADFGIARALSASAGAATTTTAGVVRGTPAYMSPEQAAGDRAIDRRNRSWRSAWCTCHDRFACTDRMCRRSSRTYSSARWRRLRPTAIKPPRSSSPRWNPSSRC
jgi:eukaryotic-like serine/threonine-protein kinase